MGRAALRLGAGATAAFVKMSRYDPTAYDPTAYGGEVERVNHNMRCPSSWSCGNPLDSSIAVLTPTGLWRKLVGYER